MGGMEGGGKHGQVKLLEVGYTITFIARYRKEQTGGTEVQKLKRCLSHCRGTQVSTTGGGGLGR